MAGGGELISASLMSFDLERFFCRCQSAHRLIVRVPKRKPAWRLFAVA
jgi:hypothetical protein